MFLDLVHTPPLQTPVIPLAGADAAAHASPLSDAASEARRVEPLEFDDRD
jgi:hypothetical protein